MSAAVAISASESLMNVGNSQGRGAIPGMPEGLSPETQVLWRNLFQQLSTCIPAQRDPLLDLRLAGVTTMLLLAARLEARLLAALEAENTPLPPAALIREACRLKTQAIQALEEIRRECASEPLEPSAVCPTEPVPSGLPAGRRHSGSGTNRCRQHENSPTAWVGKPDCSDAAPLFRPETDPDRSCTGPAQDPVSCASLPERSAPNVLGPIGRRDTPEDPVLQQAAAMARQYEDAWIRRLSRRRQGPRRPPADLQTASRSRQPGLTSMGSTP